MLPGLSTHVFLPHRLSTGLLDSMHRAGARAVELFAVRHHFDYTDRANVRELGAWFRDTGTLATLHQPLFAPGEWSRHVSPSLDLIDPDKSRRIRAMDETKRALEAAEHLPFRALTLHLGTKGDKASPRAFEHSLTAIEHLKAFATPLGVHLLLETLNNEFTAPACLLEILRTGHFDDVGVTLDVGHVHLTDYQDPGAGIDAAFDLLGNRIHELHLHDNAGTRDDHLWPGTPTPAGSGINWPNLTRHTLTLPPETPAILEIAHDLHETPESLETKAAAFFSDQQRREEAAATQPAPTL